MITPDYKLKYKNYKQYMQEKKDCELSNKLWEIVCQEPRTEAETEVEVETLKEYMRMRKVWRDGKASKKT